MTKKKKSKIKGNKLSARQLQREILKLFKAAPKKRFNPSQVAKKLKVANNRNSIHHAMEKLAENGQLTDLGDYKYQLNRNRSSFSRNGNRETYEGQVDMTRSGNAYIVCKDLKEDIYVAAKFLRTAMHGDRVKIKTWRPPGRRRREGEVIQVLERASEHFLGTIWLYPHFATVVPDGNKAVADIRVGLTDLHHAADGDKVIVKITEWQSDRNKQLKGVVTTVLGQAGSHDIEMKAILINNGFDLEFPDEVKEQSEALSEEIAEAEIALRRDVREVTTFTIDPDTAKDFDDALSLQKLENGHWEVGIHIADVTHYMQEATPLDKEAYDRSTSVYLVDRVLPMLPERLSNELCSLRPHEDKLTFSAIFEFNKRGRVINRWFGKTIIHSDRRFTYEEAQTVLESGEGDFANELQQLNKLAKILRRKKFGEGAINFETDEVKFRLDEKGSPVDVYVKERKEAHMLIEDFMLLANREVAGFIIEKGKERGEIPFVYRIHDEPDPEKVANLATFARALGFEMKIASPEEIGQSYNNLVKAAQEDPGLKLLEPLAIRTMSKAVYSTDNIGHYGLAFDHYAHFTSPIRRYADVLVHRLLEKNLPADAYYRVNKTYLEEQCKHISMQERKAMSAERESIKYKQVEFLEKHVGETFPGIISGIIDRGIFVELEGNRCEGMVDFTTMNDFFEWMDGQLQIRGQNTGKVYKMGDRIQVKILRTDLPRRQIDMAMIEDEMEGARIGKRSSRRERK